MRFLCIQNNQGQGNCYQLSQKPRLITLTRTLIISDTKTQYKSCYEDNKDKFSISLNRV